ncbi:MAG TPA: hypothetical protein VIJ26_00220, partial [Thermoanaerobaculia bacterium]
MTKPPFDPSSEDDSSREPGLAELLKSMLGFSWAMSLLGVRSLANLAQPGRAASSLDAVAQAAEGQLGRGLQDVFRTGDQLQRGMVDGVLGGLSGAVGAAAGSMPSGTAAPSGPAPVPAAVNSGALDTATFVALGEGLAAGAGDFALWNDFQHWSFPAQMARQMRTALVQPLLQPPGIGNLPGFSPLPVVIPGLMQTTVREPWPPPAAVGNLSVPGFRLADALNLRPRLPLVHRDDARQTGANLILGLPELLDRTAGELPTQLELALRRAPSLALVALGYLEAIEAVVAGDLRRLPAPGRFRADCLRLLKPLREGGAEVLVMNVPDPVDTACVSSIEAAAQVVKVEPGLL